MAAGQGKTPPLGMFGSSAPKASEYKPGQRDWWGEISSDPLGFILTGTNGLSAKRDEAMAYEAAQAAAAEKARREAVLMGQAQAAGLDPGGILAMQLNPEEFGKSYGTNYEAANVAEGASRVFGNGRETFTAPKMGVDGGYAYTQGPGGITWGDQRGQSYGEATDVATQAEVARHNRATEALERDKFTAEQTAPKVPDFGDENSFRSQYLGQAKTFQDIARATSGVRSLSTEMNPAEQMGLIFQTMKMLDPGSTVREGEYATAQNTTGLMGQFWNYYNKAQSGQFLNDTQIRDFRKMVDDLYASSEDTYAKTYDFYRGMAPRYNMDPSIIQDFRLPKDPLKSGATAPVGSNIMSMVQDLAKGGLSPDEQAELEQLRRELGQ